MEDILIDIFIGRNPQDLIDLSIKYKQVYHREFSSIAQMASSEELVKALEIVSERNRPDSTVLVDGELVRKDVASIKSTLKMSFPRYQDLFEILLHRSDTHIQQVSIMFELQQKQKPLDMAIRTNTSLSTMAKNICVHAVRTATNMTYRDAMLLRDAMGTNTVLGGGSKKKVAIRVVRMHYFKRHFHQIKGEYHGVSGKDFTKQMKNLKEGVFRDLMYAMSA